MVNVNKKIYKRTKAVAEILKEAMPDTEVVYAKAKNVSEFRHEYGFIKVREMNDLHHAKDAYLNIVVGNSYYVKFTKSAANFIRENPGRSYTLKTKELFAHDIVRNDEVAWKSGNHGTMEIVEQTMKKNNILVTRRIYEVKGGLFDQQIMKKGKGQIPIKGGDERLKNIYKYGGYNKASGAYFMLVKSLDKKNNEQRTFTIFISNLFENDVKMYGIQTYELKSTLHNEMIRRGISMDLKYCKLEIFLPPSHLEVLQKALQEVDAGHIGNYDSCMSVSPVTGYWRPLDGCNPYIGTNGEISCEPELKVEVTVYTENVDKTIEVVKAVHPYEEPVINVIPLWRTSF